MKGLGHRTGGKHEPCTVMLFKSIKDDALLRRVRGEYREMPGMRLTIDQAIRLWDLDRRACEQVFSSLVASHFLEIDANGRYRKTHGSDRPRECPEHRAPVA
jgi:hypothetical protein